MFKMKSFERSSIDSINRCLLLSMDADPNASFKVYKDGKLYGTYYKSCKRGVVTGLEPKVH